MNQQLLGMAGAFPGMDQAFKVKEGFVESISSDAEGVWVRVRLYDGRGSGDDPGRGTPVNARPLKMYAGAGWCMYFPIEVDDHVAVAVPDGAPANGCWILGTYASASSGLPDEVAEHPRDPLLFVRPDSTLRVVTSGAGNIVLDARGTGKVLLGAEEGTEAPAKAANVEARLNRLETQARYYAPAGTAGGPTSTAMLPTLAYLTDYPTDPAVITNPTHAAWVLDPTLKHVHAPGYPANPCPSAETPTINSTVPGADGGCAATKVEVI